MTDRPSVLLLLADQWRGQDQGWVGGSRVQTPHLDSLAAEGVAVAGACANSPVCGPSRASLLTGRLPCDHRVIANDLPLPVGTPTVAEVLRDEGYDTGWIGNWHLDGMPRRHWVPPERRAGFDFWASSHCSHQHVDGYYYAGDEEPLRVDFTGYEPVAQTDLAIEYIRAARGPFFLTVSVGPPHDPYDTVPERYRELYPAESIELRPNVDADPRRAEIQRLYWSAISAVDEQLGRLISALTDTGRRDDTIVVVTADHGDMLGSHGRRAKQVPYAESVSVPLVVSWPAGLPSGLRPEGMFGLVDLSPTLLGLTDAAGLGEVYGQDRSGALHGAESLPDQVLLGNWVSLDNGFDQGVPEWRGFRSTRSTYARAADATPWLLFDDVDDPYQLHNLASDPAAKALRESADRQLDALLVEANDSFLPGAALIRRLGVEELWNLREHELRGARARPVVVRGRPDNMTFAPVSSCR